MFKEIKGLIRADRRLQWILFFGLVIQIVVCMKAIGFYYFDEQFSIIEFSLHQLGKESGAVNIYEFTHFVRPTLQIYLFSGYHLFSQFMGITDPYLEMTVLRLIVGLVMFTVFNSMTIYYLKDENRKILYFSLLLLNFSWLFPYLRTLFSSEMMSSVFFFGTVFLYDYNKNKNPGFLFLSLIGFLLALSFYLRFQIGFAMIGFGIWLLLVEKRFQHAFLVLPGFILGIALNIYLDYRLYGQWVFTPYTYFYTNINAGRAASFGTSSVLVYVGVLVFVVFTIPFSLVLWYYAIRAFFKKYKHPILLTTIFFIVAHSLVGHKEERFLFPVLNVLPILIGFGLPALINYYKTHRPVVKYLLVGLLVLSVILNSVLFILLTLNPYSQTVYFSYLLKKKFGKEPTTIYCLDRTPFESESKFKMVFYRNGVKNLDFRRIIPDDSLRHLHEKGVFFTTTYNQIRDEKSMVDSLGYKPVLYSSKLLWKINEYLQSKNLSTINDVWVLYKN